LFFHLYTTFVLHLNQPITYPHSHIHTHKSHTSNCTKMSSYKPTYCLHISAFTLMSYNSTCTYLTILILSINNHFQLSYYLMHNIFFLLFLFRRVIKNDVFHTVSDFKLHNLSTQSLFFRKTISYMSINSAITIRCIWASISANVTALMTLTYDLLKSQRLEKVVYISWLANPMRFICTALGNYVLFTWATTNVLYLFIYLPNYCTRILQ
jgi:hypothetical protein